MHRILQKHGVGIAGGWAAVSYCPVADVGRTLRTFRQAKGLSASALARSAGVDTKTITNAEDSASWVIRPERFAKVLAALNVSFDRFCAMVAVDAIGDADSAVRIEIVERIRRMAGEDLLRILTTAHLIERTHQPIGDLPAPTIIRDPALRAAPSAPQTKGIDTHADPDHNAPQPPARARRRA